MEQTDDEVFGLLGMTNRDLYAAMAMIGLLAGTDLAGMYCGPSQIAIEAVRSADALIAALNEKKEG